jgi:uncharacterized membrane protein
VGFSLWAWEALPDRIPVHFDASGEPTRWAERSFWSWYVLPIISLAMAALTYGLAAAMPRYPRLVKLPHGRRLSDLPPERRGPVLAPTRDMLFAFTVPMMLMFVLIQIGAYLESLGRGGEALILVAILLAVLSTPFVLVGWLPRIQKAVNSEPRAHEAEVAGGRE